jgi:hypothetical protein
LSTTNSQHAAAIVVHSDEFSRVSERDVGLHVQSATSR